MLKYITVFLISMMPILELRGAIPIGLEWGLSFKETMIICLCGNILVVPFIVLLFNKILVVMRKIKITAKIADKLEARERQIIYLRYFEDKTQTEIARELGISQVQVSRMEKKILRIMRGKITGE